MKKYILNISDLRAGDIILTGRKEIASLSVRAFTASRYSHAALFVGDTTIEATLEGVFSKNPQRLLFDRPDDIAVYRSIRPLSDKEGLAICSYARSKTGSLYALDEAITIRVRSSLKLEPSKRQFCSRLVAESYAYAGVDLKNLRNPTYCTPRQISLCKAFEKIDGIVREATANEIDFSKSPDPTYENQKQTFQWLNNVRAMTKADPNLRKTDIQTINDVNVFLLDNPKFDKTIASYMKDSGYLDFYNHDTKPNPCRYNNILFLNVIRTHPNPEYFIKSELSKEPDMFTRFSSMLEAYINYINKINLECFRLHLELYINLISGVYVRLNVMRNCAKVIGDSELHNDIASLQRYVHTVIEEGKRCLESKSHNKDGI